MSLIDIFGGLLVYNLLFIIIGEERSFVLDRKAYVSLFVRRVGVLDVPMNFDPFRNVQIRENPSHVSILTSF